MTLEQLEQRKASLLSIRTGINALLQNIQRDIQQQCPHDFKWNQTTGEGRTCTKCGLLDLVSSETVIHSFNETPTEAGWYEGWAIDDRWNGEMRYRAWGNDAWWIPLDKGWLGSPNGIYRWRGPVADVMGPAPDGKNPL